MDTTAPAEPPRAQQGLRLGGAHAPALLAALGTGSTRRPSAFLAVLTAACTFLTACGISYWLGSQRVDAQPTTAARTVLADRAAAEPLRRAALVRLEADVGQTLRALRGIAEDQKDPFRAEAAAALARMERR